MSLSDKEIKMGMFTMSKGFFTSDIKEFIKELKVNESPIASNGEEAMIKWFNERIDKLAGEKLL